MSANPEYIPGTCNIGPEEVKNRKLSTTISAILSVALIIVLLVFHVDKIWRLLLFFPALSVGIGIEQWRNKFCVTFGLKGVFNFGERGKTFSVEQKEYLRKDRIKAWKMIITGTLFGLIFAILFYIFP